MTNTTNKRNKKEKVNPKIKGFIKHQIIIFLVFFLLCAVVCAVLYVSNIAPSLAYYFAVFSIALSAFLGGYISGRKYKKNGIMVGILYNIPVLIVFTVLSLILNGFSFDYRLFLSVSVILLFSAIGGIVAVNTRVRAK